MSITNLKKEVHHVEVEIAAKKAKISEDSEILKENASTPIILFGGILGGFIVGRLLFGSKKKPKNSSTHKIDKTAILTGLATYFLKK